jgi:hypothetical protein
MATVTKDVFIEVAGWLKVGRVSYDDHSGDYVKSHKAAKIEFRKLDFDISERTWRDVEDEMRETGEVDFE